jgi:metal-responsive CopG/Arc/MetJ family transcriptional regulator
VRLQPNLLKSLDTAATDEADHPSRPEMIRRLLVEALKAKGYLEE